MLAYQGGMLRKDELEDGEYFWGTCGNGRVAVWSAHHQRFFFRRNKAGHWRTNELPHPADEIVVPSGGRTYCFDVFCPYIKVTPLDFEVVDLSVLPNTVVKG